MKKAFQLLFVLIFSFSIWSCKDNSLVNPVATNTFDSTKTTTTLGSVSVSKINNWIYSVMSDAYFWADQLPALNTLNISSDSFDFFEKLVYNRTTIDRFSTLTDDFTALENDFNGISKIFGIRYTIAYTDSSNRSLGLFLSQIVPGSAAEKAGMQRGDVITAIDNQKITEANFNSLFDSGDTHSFTLSNTQNGILKVTKSVTATRSVTEENPLAFSKILSLPVSGKKLGYLLYNQFVPGTIADSVAYDNQMRNIISDFNTAGISELVLDLRFNGGGYISSAEVLSSLIGKDVNNSKVFYIDQWNPGYQSFFKARYGNNYFQHNFLNEPKAIGNKLSRVFVMTSNSTASASELVINGLRPYMDVITVGENTYGKNLFGTLVSDDTNNSNYGIYLMLGQTTNSLGQSDYGSINGITPDYLVKDEVIPFLPFCDFNETLFSKVLDILGEKTGTMARVKAGKPVNRVSKFTFKENKELPLGIMLMDRPYKN